MKRSRKIILVALLLAGIYTAFFFYNEIQGASIVLTYVFDVYEVRIVNAYSINPELEVIVDLDNAAYFDYDVDINLDMLVNNEYVLFSFIYRFKDGQTLT